MAYNNPRFIAGPDGTQDLYDIYYPVVAQAGAGAASNVARNARYTRGGLGSLFQRLKGMKLSDLNTMRANFVDKPIIGGASISNIANVGGGIYHGINAIQGLKTNADTEKDINSLKSDITGLVAGNPMYDMYLSPEDEKLLRQLRNNSLGSGNFAEAVGGTFESIPQAAINAGLGFLTGNVPGAIIQGVGTLANGGISGYNKGQQDIQNKLQGLYDRLSQANEEYRSMRRPNGLRSAGLQTRYYNQLY